MADEKISAMPSAGAITGVELVPLVQSSNNVQVPVLKLTNYRSDNIVYATSGTKTVTFSFGGSPAPFADTNYMLFAFITNPNGSLSFATISAKTASGFSVQIYQSNATLYYFAVYKT